MRKTITADKVKKLPVDTTVYVVNDTDGSHGTLWIVKKGRQKMLKGALTDPREIRDVPGWHYEVDK